MEEEKTNQAIQNLAKVLEAYTNKSALGQALIDYDIWRRKDVQKSVTTHLLFFLTQIEQRSGKYDIKDIRRISELILNESGIEKYGDIIIVNGQEQKVIERKIGPKYTIDLKTQHKEGFVWTSKTVF